MTGIPTFATPPGFLGVTRNDRGDPATLSLADIGDLRFALGDIPESLHLIEQQVAELGNLLELAKLRYLISVTLPFRPLIDPLVR